jgi:hypothetical protein
MQRRRRFALHDQTVEQVHHAASVGQPKHGADLIGSGFARAAWLIA